MNTPHLRHFIPLLSAAILLPQASQALTPATRCSNIAIGGKNLSQNANPANFNLIDTRLFFTASDKHGNRGVYEKDLVAKDEVTLDSNDWTLKGNAPKLLKNFKLPVGVQDMDEFAATEQNGLPKTGKVYFHVPNQGLWMTYGKTPVKLGAFDNTKNAQQEVTSMIPVQADSGAILPLVYFGGWQKKTGQELYRSQGTVKLTKIVDDLTTGTNGSNPDSMVELKQGDASTVFFRDTPNGAVIPQIWFTSTTNTSAASLALSSTLGTPTQLVTSEDIQGCYFTMPGVGSGGTNELWYTLASPGSAVQFTSGGVNPQDVTEFRGNGDSVMFSGFSPTDGRQIWEANSFIGGGEELDDINPLGDANPYDLTAALSEFYYGATAPNQYDGNNQDQVLFVTDGNPGDSVQVTNLVDSVTYSPTNPRQITLAADPSGNAGSGDVYFVADGTIDTGAGPAFHTGILWEVANDGVSQAVPVLDAHNNPILNPTNITSIVNPGSPGIFRIYFSYDDGSGFGTEVWEKENDD